MPAIPNEAYRYLEDSIYLPMLIKVLEKDLELVTNLPFKLNRPYIAIVESALQKVKADLKQSDIYQKRHNMKVIRESVTLEHSNYVFIHVGIEERKTYSNQSLRERSEELLGTYLTK